MMDLGDFMLSETSRTEKEKCCMISLTCGNDIVQFTEAESIMVVTRGQGLGEMERC